MCDFSLVKIQAVQQMRVFEQRALHALVGERQHERQRRVVEREGRGARHAARHVGDAIVDHVVDHIGRPVVRRRRARSRSSRPGRWRRRPPPRPASCGAPCRRSPVSAPRRPESAQRRSPGRLPARVFRSRGGSSTRCSAAGRTGATGGAAGRGRGRSPSDVGAHAQRDVDRVRADDAAAEHQHLGRVYAGHAAQQHAEAAVRLFEEIRARLHRHAARHFGHRREQRQAASRRSHRLVGDAGGLARDQVGRLLRIRREVKVGKQHLPCAQLLALARLRLLHLDDQLGALEDLRCARRDAGAGRRVLIVAAADPRTGIVLDDDFVAMRDELVHVGRHQAHAVLARLDFLRYPDAHRPLPIECGRLA